MPSALEQIRRMRGGAQAQLMRCEDEAFYVVKFQNNPQGTRVLANELLGTRLAARLGLPVPAAAVVEVRENLIAQTEDLVIQLPRGRARCAPGRQFGSRFPVAPAETVVFDFLPDEQLRSATNLADFCGMLVFDKWTCNTNGRQTLFLQQLGGGHVAADSSAGEKTATPYNTLMIDQGFCFNAGEWNFPDAPLRGLYARNRVYEAVTGMESFLPWLDRLEKQMTERSLDEITKQIPPAWYEDDFDAVLHVSEQLLRRRSRVPDLILEAKKSNRQPFPNWT